MKNKALKITVMLLIGVAFGIKAQSFKKGQKDINLGIGLGNTFISSGTESTIPPISASLEFGITDAISLGGYLSYSKASWTYGPYSSYYNGDYYTYTDKNSWSFYIIGVRGAYHFAEFVKNDKVDLYAGIMLGDNIAKNTYTTTDPHRDPYYTHVSTQSYGGIIFSAFGGCRYRFNDRFGVFGELGFGVAVLNLGLNIKI